MANSALPLIAVHERELLTKSEAAGQEAERIVAGARAEAARIVETEASNLAVELAQMRRDAEHQREQERLQRQRDAEQRLKELRAKAQVSAQDAVKQVVSLIVPAAARRSS